LIMDAFTCNLFKNIKYGKVKNAQLFQLSWPSEESQGQPIKMKISDKYLN
jgi:hypothetical protein